jgi:ubiquinone/menaquinone biosynthesis C-methylase UbiE
MLDKSQYSSSKKYEARIYLSRKFKTNPKSKYEWIFDHFPKNENLNILELGCGTGLFWLANRNSIVRSWSVTLSDYSEGMLESAHNSLSRLNFNFQYEIINAEDIKYPENTFDIILANNMLYHIQNASGGTPPPKAAAGAVREAVCALCGARGRVAGLPGRCR